MKSKLHLRRGLMATSLLLLFGASAHAAVELPAPADLPPVAAADAALDAYPGVLAAQSRVAAARAEGRRLSAGEYEYQARAGYTRRRESGIGGMNDWSMGIERGLRLPGKSRLDAEAGATLAAQAEERVGDARHEAARELIAAWYAALRGQSAAQAWREQAALLRQQHEVVAKRIKAGDAAKMEQSQAEAAVLQAEAEARRAEAAAAEAAASLSARFPGLPLPGLPRPGLPAPALKDGPPLALTGGANEWVNVALEHNHELAILRKETERMRIMARRHQSDLTPDPTLGLHFSRERDGQDNLLGVSLALPLPGEGRRARADVATEEARALAHMEVAAKARIVGEIQLTHTRLQGALSRLQSLKDMSLQLNGYAELAWRAYQLGETSLWEALNARKSAQDARREAMLSRLDAHETAARLLLDSHQLWPFERDHDSAH
ncbi:MAG: hypothetical protein B7Y41_05520 [Hydrogenophilales bacterium 28-61-23]|nr:MAG: hypothetical protein B7Y41_05520 [Hydrogenophilales bacterium 28-61-23]